MSKEYLEALESFYWILSEKSKYKYINSELEKYEIVKKALQRLESIDNSNPSEALECLVEIGKTLMFTDEETLESKSLKEVMPNYYATIEQALLKAQEQEKVFEIIKEKNVDIRWISENNPSREEYNTYIWTQGYCFDTLDEEEFELLKRYFK